MGPLDPLFKLEQLDVASLLRPAMIKKIRSRMRFIEDGVGRVERASGLKYPPYYVEVVLPVTASGLEPAQLGVLYARALPVETLGRLEVWVQLSAPLVAFGSKGTIHAVLAHEFIHYVELVRRFTKLDLTSKEPSATLFESIYVDRGDLFSPRLLFRDRALMRLIKRKFPNGLHDVKLEEKTLKMWLEKGLPAIRLTPESSTAKLRVSSIVNAAFDPMVERKLKELEQARSKSR